MAGLCVSVAVCLLNLGCQNEVALGEPVDLVGPDVNRSAAPGQVNVRVVSFGLSKFAYRIRESECGYEIREPKLAPQVMSVHDLPIGVQESQEAVPFACRKWRYSTPAGNTGLCSEIHYLIRLRFIETRRERRGRVPTSLLSTGRHLQLS